MVGSFLSRKANISIMPLKTIAQDRGRTWHGVSVIIIFKSTWTVFVFSNDTVHLDIRLHYDNIDVHT